MTARAASGTHAAPRTFAEAWGARGWITDLDGPVHWIEFGAATAGPPIVFVHGLGGSHLNWVRVGSALAVDRRAVALDLHGFGLTPGTRRTATVGANAELLDRFLREVVGEPAVLVGNSMGGMISILQTHANPSTVAGVVLVDPALPQPQQHRQRPDPAVAKRFAAYAVPGFGELYLKRTYARASSRELVQDVVELCFADPSRADRAVVDAGVALAEARRSMSGKEVSMLASARSLMATSIRRKRYQAMMAGILVPVLLINGEADRLVPIASAREAAALNPGWDTVFLPGVGHTPQLEIPDLVIDSVAGWLARNPTLTTG
ncbi:MAG: alpha/beta fold hydrolase [Jatrophihabitantaceae bacterium]